MREIVPGLFLSGWADAVEALDGEALEQGPFFVVNCTKHLPMLGRPGAGMRVPVEDNGSERSSDDMLALLGPAAAAIRDRLAAGDRVVVHCQAGQQRSPAVVAAYLMAEGGCGADLAMSRVCARKMDAFFHKPNFRDALERFGSK
jgi:hypothetical protein